MNKAVNWSHGLKSVAIAIGHGKLVSILSENLINFFAVGLWQTGQPRERIKVTMLKISSYDFGRLLANVLLTWLMALFGFGTASAQVAPTASLTGTVTDVSAGAIDGASVTLTNVGTHFTKQTETGSDGKFSFTLIPGATV